MVHPEQLGRDQNKTRTQRATMTRAQSQQGEPDPGHFERCCVEIVPEMLARWEVSEELAPRVGEDILMCAESFGALSQETRDALIAPFVEEVACYEPQSAPLPLRGAVAVVVRSSLLEEAHANGPVTASGIKGVTSLAAMLVERTLQALDPRDRAAGVFARRVQVPVTVLVQVLVT
jgi:hypothetical protein